MGLARPFVLTGATFSAAASRGLPMSPGLSCLPLPKSQWPRKMIPMWPCGHPCLQVTLPLHCHQHANEQCLPNPEFQIGFQGLGSLGWGAYADLPLSRTFLLVEFSDIPQVSHLHSVTFGQLTYRTKV